MPYAGFGILTVVRTHRILKPDVEMSAQSGLPLACNQCHLDKSLTWSHQWMRRWYWSQRAQPPASSVSDPLHPSPTPASQPTLSASRSPDPDADLAASVVALFAGDAMERLLAAWSMGWPDAHQTQPHGRHTWVAPFLMIALEDDYPAVRFQAYQSLRRLPGMEGISYDYLAPVQERRWQTEAIRLRWVQMGSEAGGRGLGAATPPVSSPNSEAYRKQDSRAVPIDAGGRPLADVVDRLLKKQDQTQLHIAE